MTRRKPKIIVQATKCSAMTNDGRPCPAPAIRGTPTCLWHSEDKQKQLERLVAQKTGALVANLKGRHLKPGHAIQEPRDLLVVIEGAINDLAAVPNNASRADALAKLSREWRETFVLAEAAEGRIIEVAP